MATQTLLTINTVARKPSSKDWIASSLTLLAMTDIKVVMAGLVPAIHVLGLTAIDGMIRRHARTDPLIHLLEEGRGWPE